MYILVKINRNDFIKTLLIAFDFNIRQYVVLQ
jgi:hypothetical protein